MSRELIPARQKLTLPAIGIILGVSSILSGCLSSAPSDRDIKNALTERMEKICPIASIHNVKKENGMEEVIDGNKYYKVDFSFDFLLKWNSEWNEKYKNHLEYLQKVDEAYEFAKMEATALENTEVQKNKEDREALISDYDALRREVTRLRGRPQSQAEADAADALTYELRMRAKAVKAQIDEHRSMFKENIQPKFRKIVDEYQEQVKHQGAVRYRYVDYERKEFITEDRDAYPFPEKINVRDMEMLFPSSCLLNRDPLIYEINQFAFGELHRSKKISSEGLIDGLNVGVSMERRMRKSEKGWIFFN